MRLSLLLLPLVAWRRVAAVRIRRRATASEGARKVVAERPRVESANFSVGEGSLTIYVPSEEARGGERRQCLVPQQKAHNFTQEDVAGLNYSRAHGLLGTAPQVCTPATTIFDLGFFDGADSRGYLEGGYCVVGVEADPDLVMATKGAFAVWMASGQLKMVNAAVAPTGNGSSWTTFYRNRCTREWNSFYMSIGCRACTPPHNVLPPPSLACDPVPVSAISCAEIFGVFGVPHYLKLDIEGAETGCFEAMGQLLAQGGQLPRFVSAEITELLYIDTLHNLGYGGLKLVRQDRLHTGAGSTSGPWGDNALDCRRGTAWRSYEDARSEMQAILSKGLDATDACPGGVLKIRGNTSDGGSSNGYMWYDIHATLDPPSGASPAPQ